MNKPKDLEGPLYAIDLEGKEDATFYPLELQRPEATVTSLFLMKCSHLLVDPSTEIIKGFSFEQIIDIDSTMSVDAKIVKGPTWRELKNWYDNLDASPLVTRHVPEITLEDIIQSDKRSGIFNENIDAQHRGEILVNYCEDCNKIVKSDDNCIDLSHNRGEMTLARFLNWKLLGRE